MTAARDQRPLSTPPGTPEYHENTATYSVGDYVWALEPTQRCLHAPPRQVLAQVAGALEIKEGRPWWRVRLYLRHTRKWSPYVCLRRVDRALSAATLAAMRRRGHIPPLGVQLELAAGGRGDLLQRDRSRTLLGEPGGRR